MIFYLLFISAIVSLDAFFSGIAIGIKNKFNFKQVLICSSVVILMCFSNYFLIKIMKDFINFNANFWGGILFILLGIKSLIDEFSKKEKQTTQVTNKTFAFLGFTLGLDGSFAIFTLKEEMISILAPSLIVLSHATLFSLGWFTTHKLNKLQNLSFLSGTALIILGILKVTNLF